METQGYHALVQKGLNDAAAKIVQLTGMNSTVLEVEQILPPNFHISYLDYEINIGMDGQATSIQDFTELFRALNKAGFRENRDRRSLPVAEALDFKFHFECSLRTSVRVWAYLNKEAANCKLVKTGERTVPVYELVCDEGVPDTPTEEQNREENHV